MSSAHPLLCPLIAARTCCPDCSLNNLMPALFSNFSVLWTVPSAQALTFYPLLCTHSWESSETPRRSPIPDPGPRLQICCHVLTCSALPTVQTHFSSDLQHLKIKFTFLS